MHARQGEQLIYSGFGSFAVGAVEVENSSASFGALRVFRVAVLGAGERLPNPVYVRDTLTIVDGPLSFEPERRGVVLGYIKRVHELYVPAKFIPLPEFWCPDRRRWLTWWNLYDLT